MTSNNNKYGLPDRKDDDQGRYGVNTDSANNYPTYNPYNSTSGYNASPNMYGAAASGNSYNTTAAMTTPVQGGLPGEMPPANQVMNLNALTPEQQQVVYQAALQQQQQQQLMVQNMATTGRIPRGMNLEQYYVMIGCKTEEEVPEFECEKKLRKRQRTNMIIMICLFPLVVPFVIYTIYALGCLENHAEMRERLKKEYPNDESMVPPPRRPTYEEKTMRMLPAFTGFMVMIIIMIVMFTVVF